MTYEHVGAVTLGNREIRVMANGQNRTLTHLPEGFTQATVYNEIAGRLSNVGYLTLVHDSEPGLEPLQIDNGKQLTRINVGTLSSSLAVPVTHVSVAQTLAAHLRQQVAATKREFPNTALILLRDNPKGQGGDVRWYALSATELKELDVTFLGDRTPGGQVISTPRPLTQTMIVVNQLLQDFLKKHPPSQVTNVVVHATPSLPPEETDPTAASHPTNQFWRGLCDAHGGSRISVSAGESAVMNGALLLARQHYDRLQHG